MAAQYFLRREGQDAGPFSFRDLVAMVREGNLADSHLVRFSWTDKWQRADSLVGLWHMAQRTSDSPAPSDTLADSEAVSVAPVTVESEIQNELGERAPISDVDNQPSWMKRLLFIGTRKKTPAKVPIFGPRAPELPPASAGCAPPAHVIPVFHTGLVEDVDHSADSSHKQNVAAEAAASAQSDAAMSRSRWSSTVEDALASVAVRQSGHRRQLRQGRWRRVFDRLLKFMPRNWSGNSWLHIGYRVACTIVFAAIVAVSVENWSEEEGRRFLRGEHQKATIRIFPVVGKCGNGQYLFLMADLLLATGAVAWFAAGWVESHAE